MHGGFFPSFITLYARMSIVSTNPRSGISIIEVRISLNAFTTGKVRHEIQYNNLNENEKGIPDSTSRGFSSKVQVTSSSELNFPSIISYGMEGELRLQITESDPFVVRTLQLHKSSPAGVRFLTDPSI